MILRTHTISLMATAIISASLPVCLPSLGLMIVWLFAFSFYAGLIGIGYIELEQIQRAWVGRVSLRRTDRKLVPDDIQ